MSLFAELKRRNVFRVGIAYAVAAWLLIQIADIMIDNIGAPDWVFRTVLLVLAIGFPVSLIMAWAFELTGNGIRRESEADVSESTNPGPLRFIGPAVIALLAVALGVLLYQSGKQAGSDSGQADLAGKTVAEALLAEEAGSAKAINPKSIAILPFLNMSADEDQEYFSDGITEEIINAVVKIPGVSVPARTTVFAYKGHQGDLREVGETLGVAHILEGSIRSQGDQIRVTAQLIKVEDGFHLWSETFDRRLDNIFAVQEEIASAIAAELVGNLGGAPVTIPNQTSNMAAYDAYLKGRAALRDRDPVARVYLQQAIDADPEFAPAYAAMAISYQSMNENPDLAVAMADRALALDPSNVDALNAKAASLRHYRRWLEAESMFQQALAIDPSSAELLEDYAEFLAFVGRMDEALQVTSRGMSIDPNLVPLVAAHLEALYANGEGARARQLAAPESTDQGWLAGMWLVAMPLWLDQSLFTDFVPAPPRPEILQYLGPDTPQWAQQALGLANTAAIQGLQALSPRDVETLKSFYGVRTVGSALDRFFGIAITRGLLINAGEIDHVIAADLSLIERDLYPLHEWQWTPSRAQLRQHPLFPDYLAGIGLIEYWDATSWPSFCKRNPEGVIQCQ